MSELSPGKYKARVQSHGVRENTRLPESPLEAFATFECEGQKVYWNGLLLTKSGERNTKTMKCLAALGCEDGDVVDWLGQNLEGGHVQLTLIEKDKRDGSKVLVVDWVNSLSGADGSGTTNDVVDKLKAAGFGGEGLPF